MCLVCLFAFSAGISLRSMEYLFIFAHFASDSNKIVNFEWCKLQWNIYNIHIYIYIHTSIFLLVRQADCSADTKYRVWYYHGRICCFCWTLECFYLYRRARRAQHNIARRYAHGAYEYAIVSFPTRTRKVHVHAFISTAVVRAYRWWIWWRWRIARAFVFLLFGIWLYAMQHANWFAFLRSLLHFVHFVHCCRC